MFEILREIPRRLVLLMGAPKVVGLAFGNGSVELVLVDLGGEKRRGLGDHREQDNTQGEQIYLLAIVRLACIDLRRLVTFRAKLLVQQAGSISACHRASESEVRNLEVEVLIQEEILRLQISVRNTRIVAVAKAGQRLLEVVAGDGLAERFRINEIEHLAIFSDAEHRIVDYGVLVHGLSGLDLFKYVGMRQLLHRSNLLIDQLSTPIVEIGL